MMKILPVSLRSRWSCSPLCLALAFAGCGGGNGGVVNGGNGAGTGGVLFDGGAGGSSGEVLFDGEKAPYGPRTPATQMHSTVTFSAGGVLPGTNFPQVTAVVGQKVIGGVTYDRLATTHVDDPKKGSESWIKNNPDGTVTFAGFAHSDLVGGLIPAASVTLNTPITVKLDSPVGVAQPVTASGTLTLTDTLAASPVDATGQFTLVEKDVTVATGVGPVSGCSHFSGQATSNSEGVPAVLRGLPISAELWYHPSYGIVAFNSPEVGIGTAMSDSSDCGSVDSSGSRIIRKVGVVDSSSSFNLDTYDCDGNQLAADKNTHAQMLLELRWVDETKAQTDTQPLPNVEFGTTMGYFPNSMAESPASVFHPEENGKGFKYWYSYVNQAAKSEPGVSTSYHIKVGSVAGLSPVRVTARIYYTVISSLVGPGPDAAVPDAGMPDTRKPDSGMPDTRTPDDGGILDAGGVRGCTCDSMAVCFQGSLITFTPANPIVTLPNVPITAPAAGFQDYTSKYDIDVSAFASGGTISVNGTLGSNGCAGTFDLLGECTAFVSGAGYAINSLAHAYDRSAGSSFSFSYPFQAGDTIFHLGLEGNWLSPVGQTNTVAVTITVVP